jgi:hypothetical protein
MERETMNNLKTMTDEELRTLRAQIDEELSTRSPQMVRCEIVVGEASGGRRGWVKHVTGIDTTQSGGYAFVGDWLKDGLVDLPAGALVLDCYPTGSRRSGGKTAELCVVTPGKGLVVVAETEEWPKRSLELRDEAEKLL